VKLNDDAGALRATNNRGLQPAMDFILEHNDDPIPDATSGAAATSSAAQPQTGPMDEDEDEDTAALRAAYGLKAGAAGATDSDAGVEARVSRRAHHWQLVIYIWHYGARVSNVQSAERYLKTQRSPTSTQRRVDTISSRSPPTRCALLLH